MNFHLFFLIQFGLVLLQFDVILMLNFEKSVVLLMFPHPLLSGKRNSEFQPVLLLCT